MTASLATVLGSSASERRAKAAILTRDRTITYGELDDRASRVAGALQAAGVRAGDRVALVLGNSPEFVETLHGAWRIGAVVAPLNVMLTPEEAGYVLADAEAAVVVTDRDLLPTVLAVRDRIGSIERVFVTGGGPAPAETVSYESALKETLPPSVQMIVQRQAAKVRQAHDSVRDLRDREKVAH